MGRKGIIADLEFFRRWMFVNGTGAVFLDHDGRGWYVGDKIAPADVLLIPYRHYNNWEEMVAAFFREYREHIAPDNQLKNRDRFTRAYLNYMYEELINLKARGVTPAGGNYDRHNEA